LMSQALNGKIKSALIFAGLAHALGLIIVAVFHQTANSIQDKSIFINIAGAALALIAGNGILIIAGSQWRKSALPAWFGWFSIALGSLAILLGFALFGNPSIAPGIRERISIDSFIFWQIIAGIILIFKNNSRQSNIGKGRPDMC
jgi:peptidoglycan/LPS O-acetylase OafA/YrhL